MPRPKISLHTAPVRVPHEPKSIPSGSCTRAMALEVTVNLLTIYDKADTASISDKELKELI